MNEAMTVLFLFLLGAVTTLFSYKLGYKKTALILGFATGVQFAVLIFLIKDI
jgi:hypothetical protein